MIPKKEVSFFKRYLKEKGLYNVFKHDLVIGLQYNKTPLRTHIEYRGRGGTMNIIMDCLLWQFSKYQGWQKLYDEYPIYFSKHYNTYKND